MIELGEKGIVLVDKPADWTSFDVVAKIRGSIRASYRARGEKPTKRQLRVGHAGTLDPFATGLLIILLGDACKQAGQFLKLDKVYEATFVLGKNSTTGDLEGEFRQISDRQPGREEVERAVAGFIGDIMQTPPAYSAISVNGQRAYKLAREGKEVKLEPRQVTIHSLEIINYDYPRLSLRAHVGSGTYIRSLGEDIGSALGVGAYCEVLRRTKIANYNVDDARTVEEVAANLRVFQPFQEHQI